MTEIQKHVDLYTYTNSDSNPWFVAYMTLRNAIIDPRHLAMPVKCLGGVLTVCEAEIARRQGLPLTSIYGLIQDDYNRLHGGKDAKDEGESPLG